MPPAGATAGLPYSRNASVAKLVATDAAMKVTTDAVQVFGGYGYTQDFPVERYMREAKITQIFEGTNQISATRHRPPTRGADGRQSPQQPEPPGSIALRISGWLRLRAARSSSAG